jgi:hypothetical protein
MRYLVVIIISVVVLGILIASNPSLQDHRIAVKSKVNKIIDNELSSKGSNDFGNSLLGKFAFLVGNAAIAEFVDDIVRENVNRKNYLLFSLTSIEYKGDSKVVGVGVLGNVIISSQFDNTIYQFKQKFENLIDDLGISENGNNRKQEEINDNYERQNNNARQYIVKASSDHKVHFYNTPDYSSMRKSYFDTRDVVTPSQIVNGFAYVIFTNTMNQTSKGWLPMEELELLSDY